MAEKELVFSTTMMQIDEELKRLEVLRGSFNNSLERLRNWFLPENEDVGGNQLRLMREREENTKKYNNNEQANQLRNGIVQIEKTIHELQDEKLKINQISKTNPSDLENSLVVANSLVNTSRDNHKESEVEAVMLSFKKQINPIASAAVMNLQSPQISKTNPSDPENSLVNTSRVNHKESEVEAVMLSVKKQINPIASAAVMNLQSPQNTQPGMLSQDQATAAVTVPKSEKLTLLDDKGNNYATGITRDDAKGCYIMHGTTDDSSGNQPRQIQLYDNGRRTGFKDSDNLGIVGNQLYENREAIFKHFKVELPVTHKPSQEEQSPQFRR